MAEIGKKGDLDTVAVKKILVQHGMESSGVVDLGYSIGFKMKPIYGGMFTRKGSSGGMSPKSCRHGYEAVFQEMRNLSRKHGASTTGEANINMFDASTPVGQRNEILATRGATCACDGFFTVEEIPLKGIDAALDAPDTPGFDFDSPIQSLREGQIELVLGYRAYNYDPVLGGLVGAHNAVWESAVLIAECTSEERPVYRRRTPMLADIAEWWRIEGDNKLIEEAQAVEEAASTTERTPEQQLAWDHLMNDPGQCMCGIYCYKNPGKTIETYGRHELCVLAQVELSGAVYEATQGFKASRVEILQLWTWRQEYRDKGIKQSDFAVCAALEAQYGVPADAMIPEKLDELTKHAEKEREDKGGISK